MPSPKHQKTSDNKNINRMRDIVRNTENNLQEAEFSKEFADPIDQEWINEKNNRRKNSIEELKEEIKEEISKNK